MIPSWYLVPSLSFSPRPREFSLYPSHSTYELYYPSIKDKILIKYNQFLEIMIHKITLIIKLFFFFFKVVPACHQILIGSTFFKALSSLCRLTLEADNMLFWSALKQTSCTQSSCPWKAMSKNFRMNLYFKHEKWTSKTTLKFSLLRWFWYFCNNKAARLCEVRKGR